MVAACRAARSPASSQQSDPATAAARTARLRPPHTPLPRSPRTGYPRTCRRAGARAGLRQFASGPWRRGRGTVSLRPARPTDVARPHLLPLALQSTEPLAVLPDWVGKQKLPRGPTPTADRAKPRPTAPQHHFRFRLSDDPRLNLQVDAPSPVLMY